MENVRSVERAIRILKQISTKKDGLRISEISARLDLHSATVIRLLSTLEKEGFVARDLDTLAYRLGTSLVDIATNLLQDRNIHTVAHPFMQSLVNEAKETVALFVISGTNRVCVDRIEGIYPIRWHIEFGDSAPLGISSSGKLLLANASKFLLETVLDMDLSYIDGSKVDAEELKVELERIRKRGYAFSSCENSLDGAGVSAPIKNAGGKVVAALTILGPANRIRKSKIDEYSNLVISSASGISSALGCVG